MTHHLDGVAGLLAPAAAFYRDDNYFERAVYALEWVNAFAHTPAALRGDLKFRGGTAAQLHFGVLQRLSRDIDLVGSTPDAVEIPDLLDAIADRYGRQLFTWQQRDAASAAVPMQKYLIGFPSATAGSPQLNLSLDITFMPLTLPVVSVPLAQSQVYRPSDAADTVETWTPAGFIADKLPTLGFNTHGYARPVLHIPGESHPENIWKQLHDLNASAGLALISRRFFSSMSRRSRPAMRCVLTSSLRRLVLLTLCACVVWLPRWKRRTRRRQWTTINTSKMRCTLVKVAAPSART